MSLSSLKSNKDFFNLVVNSLDNIIFVVDRNINILEYNNSLLESFKTNEKAVLNVRCGHALNCSNALVEGAICGETLFCSTCTIRKTFLEVIENKGSIRQQPISKVFQFENRRVQKHFLMSAKHTRYRGEDVAIVILNDISELAESKIKLEEMIIRDDLTGIYNRRYLFNELQLLISSAKRYNINFSILMADLDNFKSINDTLGHQMGDMVLKEVAHHLKEELRDTDIIGRYGGEEFMVILPHIDKTDALKCAERLRRSVEGLRVDGLGRKTTISIGLAEYKLGMSMEALIHMADALLYRAKDLGRNRIEV